MPERDPVAAFRLAEDATFARYGVTVAEHRLDLGGRTIRVLESGDGPPIVLVPGDGAVAGAWAPLMAELPGHRTIVLDRPGAGLSGAFDRGVAALGMPGVSLPGVRPQPPMRLLSVPGLGQLLARIPAPSPDATGRMLAKTDARLLGGPDVVRRAADLMPDARVEVVPGLVPRP